MENKGLILMVVIVVFALCFVSFTSAELFQFDNVKSYDAIKQEVTITNTFGLGKDIATIQLKTPLRYEVPIGYQKVAEFQLTNYKDYLSAFEKIEFYDKNENMKQINKVFDYKVLTNLSYKVNDYSKELTCEKNTDEKNLTETCYYKIIGTHLNYYTDWIPLEKSDFLDGDIKTIGIFTQVYLYDDVEWVPTYYGVKINEWASFVQSSGTKTTDGTYTVYTFTSNGTFNVTRVLNVTVLIVAGGGAGGSHSSNIGGGAGAGGLVYGGVLNITTGNYNIIVGVGGIGIANYEQGQNGTNSSAFGLIANGGGGGGAGAGGGTKNGANGGSAGGGSWGGTGGTKTQGNFSNATGFGMNGGNSTASGGGAGGGGANNNGGAGGGTTGIGGAGRQYSINGTATYYAGGGGGGGNPAAGQAGGLGGGGQGGDTDNPKGRNGINGTGGGGGGASYQSGGNVSIEGGNGGSGIVIVRYLTSDGELIPQVTLNSPINYFNTTNPSITFNATITDEQKINNVTLYIDGVLNETNTSNVNGTYLFNKTLSEGNHNWSILAYNNNSQANQSATRTLWVNTIPQVTLSAPENYANLTYNSVWFNSSVLSVYNIQNVSLYINGTINLTNTSGINGTYKFNVGMGDNFYNWSILACSSLGGCNQSLTRYLTIDSVFPIITISSPTNGTNIYFSNLTLNNIANAVINWTVIEANPSVCLITNVSSGVNLTGTCNSMNKTFYVPYGNYLFRVYANDTFGHDSSSSTNATYRYRVYEINQSYSATTTEYALENYSANVYIDSLLSIANVTLDYNGTNYSASYTTIGNYSKIYKNNFLLPAVASDSNNTFSFYVALNDSSFIKLTVKTQQENNLSFGECSSYANRLFNFTLVDEKLQTGINGTIETNILFKSSDGLTSLYNWTTSIYNTTLMLCSNANLSSSYYYLVSGTIKYYASNGNYSASVEYYNFLNYLLNNVTQKTNNTLYDLNVSQATDFQLTFKDSSGLAREGILIYVYRQYLPEGFKIVEVPKTDSNGQVVVHLVRNDVLYNFVAVDSNGNVLGTLNNVIAFCQDYTIGNCIINFRGTSTETGLGTIINDSGISYTLSFNNATNNIHFTFYSLSTVSKIIRMEVISSGVATNRTICDVSTSGVLGVLDCDVSSLVNSTASVNVKIFVDGVQKIQDSISFENSNWNVGGVIFFGFLFILILGIFFMESKSGLVIATILGFIVLIALGIVKGKVIGITSGVIWLIIVGIILLIKLNGEKQ